MIEHPVRVYRNNEGLAREDQLAWMIAQVPVVPVEVAAEVCCAGRWERHCTAATR